MFEPDQILAFRSYLDPIVDKFEQPEFIQDDPISIPHGFSDPEDQTIAALFAALLAWGRRDIMLAKLAELCQRMDFQPSRFVRSYKVSTHRKALSGFVHRTFNASDAEGMVLSIQALLYKVSLEQVFLQGYQPADSIEQGIEQLSNQIFEHVPGQPKRIRKHLARPSTGSACKRWNMFLRWMVRTGPVDLGIWTQINPSDLMLPLDVHSGNQARNVGLVYGKQNDWKAAVELTNACKLLCPNDPAKYDFALFGTGAAGDLLQAPKSTTQK